MGVRGAHTWTSLLTCNWLMAFQRRQNFSVFLNDITGIFERVETVKLFAKLHRLWFCKKKHMLFKDYLAPRAVQIAVNKLSNMFTLSNAMLQDKIFQPHLRNIFFADVDAPAQRNFADELFKRSSTKHYQQTNTWLLESIISRYT